MIAPPPCLILAAGFGTRMGALTATCPKPLLKVSGRTLLDHALDLAQGADAPEIAVNAHYLSDQIANHLAGSDVTLLEEQPDILDSGGAVKNAARHFPAGPLATLNSDNAWQGPNVLRALARAFEPGRMGALLAVAPRSRVVGRQGGGDFRMDQAGRLHFDASDDTLVYLGAQILDPAPAIADARDIFSMHAVWQAYAREGRLFGMVYDGVWADVGHPAGLDQAEAMLEAHDV